MKIIEIKVYQFDELNDKAKQKAIANLSDINVDSDWWESTYEDAKNVGIEISEFDLDRGDFCKGKFIENALFTANKIKEEHGEDCTTYKTALNFLEARTNLFLKDGEERTGEDEIIEEEVNDLEEEFLYDILRNYLKILKDEYEYLTSEKAIIEGIEANEYDFTEDGKIFNKA